MADGHQAAWSDRVGALSRVADAEGVLESFLVRLTLERELDRQDLDRLWCFRRGYKQLRYSVRDDQPLLWWRAAGPGKDAGFRDYRAFKRLSVGVAALLVPAPEEGAERPSADVALRNLEYVTGSGEELETHYASILQEVPAADRDAQRNLWVAVAEALPMPPAQRGTEQGS